MAIAASPYEILRWFESCRLPSFNSPSNTASVASRRDGAGFCMGLYIYVDPPWPDFTGLLSLFIRFNAGLMGDRAISPRPLITLQNQFACASAKQPGYQP